MDRLILRLLLRLLLNVDERLCRAKGRGTWAESARATSRSFGKTCFFFFFFFDFSFSALSLSLSQSVHVHLLARARARKAKSKKRKARKADQGFFWGSEKRIQSLSLSLYLNFNRLRKDAKSDYLSLF